MSLVHRRRMIRVRNSLWLRVLGFSVFIALCWGFIDTCGHLGVKLARVLL